jgi:hypothetical protein
MIQEEKELLLKDLCARLPYGVFCEIYNSTCTIKEKLSFGGITHFADDTICVRPFLRPMSSMTEEEKKEYFNRTMTIDIVKTSKEVIDYCLSHHFDFMGLIEKGLAIEVTESNNPYKN